VPPELGGKGIGSKLIRGALDQVRDDGLKVIPQCPFVKAFIEKHPDYQDLLK
jgi:predicted GNAT family acetyltransferase